MSNFVNHFKVIFKEIHLKYIRNKIISSDLDFNRIAFDVPNDKNKGDLTTNIALIYQKYSSLNSIDISYKIKKELSNLNEIENIDIIKPGFVNIYLTHHLMVISLLIVLFVEI